MGRTITSDLQHPAVLAALIRRFYEAREQGLEPTLWGPGPRGAEFLHVDDCAAACLFLMELPDPMMPGTLVRARDLIADLAALVAEAVGYRGNIHWGSTKPDGTHGSGWA